MPGWCSSSPRQYFLRLHKVRAIEHLAIQAGDACVWIGRKHCDDRFGMRDLLGRWREGCVDDRNLRRMDGKHSLKSVTSRASRRQSKSCLIAEIGV